MGYLLSTLKTYFLVYILGGITFLPLTLIVVFFLLPSKKSTSSDDEKSIIDNDLKVGEYMDSVQSPEKSGFITVMSKFNKSTISGKHNRNTGLEMLAVESSIYSRLKSNSKFFCQLKNNNIVLYSDNVEGSDTMKAHEENSYNIDVVTSDLNLQETKKVIALKDCYVTLWPPNLTEGSLFTKKTSILIIKKNLYDSDTNTFKLATKIEHFISNNVFFLQFENNFDKEDWFFTILQSQKHAYEKEVFAESEPKGAGFVDGLGHFFDIPPPTYHFQTKDVAKLMALNNADFNHINCKWFNLVLSRIFMASKANNKIENAIKEKIEEKLSKVNISFLDEFVINDLKLGNIPPLLSNPKVIKMDLEGDLEVHFDILFDSNFTLNISTLINLLNKPYPIELKLDIKKLRGTIILIFKKPPSNRLWYTFKSIPALEMEIDPVIVNKSVSYSKILKPLKNKILDSFKEVLVYPNFEDINYYKMSDEHKDNFYKGGLWDFTGFEEAFAQNESETLDNSADDNDIKEEIITEEVVVSEVIKDNDDSNNDKGSVLSTGISVFSTGTEQPKNGLKERRTFKDLLKRSTNTFTNDNSSDNHEVEKDTQDVSSNSSNESGAKKVTSKFNTFYQKAKKSASTMIENMKTESETELNDEKEELNKAPVEKEEDHFENEKLKKASVEEEEDHFEKEEPNKAPVEEEEDHFENPFDQIPKLPKRRPLPPIPGDQIAETIRKESIQQSTIDQEVKHDLSTSPVAVTPLVQIEQIQQVEQIQQKVEVQHKEAKAQQDVLTDNKASVTEDP